MPDFVETMAYRGEVPWHGLGEVINDDMTTKEKIVAAQLDWNVVKTPMFMKSLTGGFRAVPNKNALIRDSDEKYFSTVSDNWNPVQNLAIVEFFDRYSKSGGVTLETLGSLKGGRVVWALAKLNHSFAASTGDNVNGYLFFATFHEVGYSTFLKTTAVRVVCWNTFQAALGSSGLINHAKQNHMSAFDFEKAAENVERAHENLTVMEKQAHALVDLKLSTPDTVMQLAQVMQPELTVDLAADPDNWSKQVQQVMESIACAPGAMPNTGWGVLQGFTHWSNHVAGNSPDARLQKAWLGVNDKLSQQLNTNLLKLTDKDLVLAT